MRDGGNRLRAMFAAEQSSGSVSATRRLKPICVCRTSQVFGSRGHASVLSARKTHDFVGQCWYSSWRRKSKPARAFRLRAVVG